MSPDAHFLVFMAILWIIWWVNQSTKIFTLNPRYIPCKSKILANVPDRFVDFDNSVHRSKNEEFIVPNIVHFIRVGAGSEELRPGEAACISAALRTQVGSQVMVHSDREPRGGAWQRLLQQGRLHVLSRPRPVHVYGLPLRDEARIHRLTALRVLTKYGGMYVSNSTYLLADLADYRRYECAVLDDQVVVAHRDARQLRRWLHLFHDADLAWERRPPAEQRLCRGLTARAVLHLGNATHPPTRVSVEDRHFWTDESP